MVSVKESEGEKISYVVAGAILSCSLGTAKSQLKLPASHGVYLKGKAQMNVNDFIPEKNVCSFGGCQENGVCQPQLTMPWLHGNEDVLIAKEPALLHRCINHCMHGGTIRIEDDGQTL